MTYIPLTGGHRCIPIDIDFAGWSPSDTRWNAWGIVDAKDQLQAYAPTAVEALATFRAALTLEISEKHL